MADSPKLTAVDKALEVLNVVGQLSGQGEIRVADIVQHSGLQRAAVHRSLASLKQYGLIKQDDQGIRLGTKVLELASKAYANMDIRRIAKPLMERFSELTGQTIHLAQRDHLEVVYIDKIQSRQEIVLASGIGWRGAIHCTALGKAMLAYTAETVREAAFAAPLIRKTDYTLTTQKALRDALEEVRRCGYAIDDRENENEIRCVAAPLLNEHGLAIAGVSISGTTSQVSLERAHELGAQLAGACQELSSELGYTR
jgi:IclR family acetate operon transcriptional repressor